MQRTVLELIFSNGGLCGRARPEIEPSLALLHSLLICGKTKLQTSPVCLRSVVHIAVSTAIRLLERLGLAEKIFFEVLLPGFVWYSIYPVIQ